MSINLLNEDNWNCSRDFLFTKVQAYLSCVSIHFLNRYHKKLLLFIFELFHSILFVNVIINDEIVNFYEGQLKVLLLKQKVSADRLFRSALVDYSVKVSMAICI